MKFLILLLYYQRPLLVRNALNSIKKTKYNNWHVAFIDDSSPTPGRPIAEEILSDHLDKVSFYYTDTSEAYKKAHGSLIGKFCNQAIQESDADVVLFLCDDDELHPDYLEKLSRFFRAHPQCVSAYSHIYPYNPAFEKSENVRFTPAEISKIPYNRWTAPVRAAGRFDASQVAWPMWIHKQHNIWFSYPKTKNLDYDIYIQIYNKFGKKGGRADFTQIISQYKSVTPVCLFVRDDKITDFDLKGLERLTPVNEIIQLAEHYAKFNMPEAIRIARQGIDLYPDTIPLKKLKKRLQTHTKKFSVIIASYGAKDLLENTVCSLIEVGAEYIDKIYIIDSSHLEKGRIYKETVDKILELKQRFAHLDIIRHMASKRHNHGKKLDRAIFKVQTPYTLIADSDVEFYKGSIFSDALKSFEDEQVFMIGNMQPEKMKNNDPTSIEAARLEPYCLFVRTSTAREYVNAGYAFYRKSTIEPNGSNRKRVFYDTASYLFHRAIKKRWKWVKIDTTAYRHIGHGSWYKHYVKRSSGSTTDKK